ncbi:lipoprotein [Streptomyces sp. NBRC 14336]|uniref:hypothetical protein n=1 Tax=Streptomyces sp. NBRC 14336 TaxID=3030992 RepID=UPI0024A08783|nr:hypothetical protein [Streptomyces sp. NBRC 14336]GLW44786.1 lipoprotein [Streptomyces sp. NBRC 14336]
MNRRPTLLTALALTAAAALTLSACGSGDDAKTTGADEANGKSPSPSATGTPASTQRPKITFPADAKNVFEDQKTGDRTKDAVLADSALAVNAVDEAIFEGTTDTKALGFYNTGKALESSVTFVRQYIDGGDTWTGDTRYYDYKVTLSGADKAYVTYCADESKSYIKNRKTGKVEKSPATADSYVQYDTSLAKNDRGVWQTTSITSNGGAEPCQP